MFECTGCPHYGYCIPDDCADMKKTHEQQPLVKGQGSKKKNFYLKDTTKKAKRQWTTKLLLTQKAE